MKRTLFRGGDVFGEWVIIDPQIEGIRGRCVVQCSCGLIKSVQKCTLRKGDSLSCGHTRKVRARNRFQLLSKGYKNGDRVGRWTVLQEAPRKPPKDLRQYVVLCDCGVRKVRLYSELRYGKSLSCGCRSVEACRKHGESRSRTYSIWAGMKTRCLNVNGKFFKDYGGRGIHVCDEWVRDYEAFVKDMGRAPKGLSLDRIDNEKGYSKDNCRWTDQIHQSRNKRSSRRYYVHGTSISQVDLCRVLGKSRENLLRWREKYGVGYIEVLAELSLSGEEVLKHATSS